MLRSDWSIGWQCCLAGHQCFPGPGPDLDRLILSKRETQLNRWQNPTWPQPDKRRRQPTGLESILRNFSFAGLTSNVKKTFCEGFETVCFLVGNGTPVKWLRFVKYCNKRESYTSPTSVGLAFTSVKSFLSLLSLLYFLFSVSLSGESVYNVSSKRGTPVHKTLSKRRVSGTTILWDN